MEQFKSFQKPIKVKLTPYEKVLKYAKKYQQDAKAKPLKYLRTKPVKAKIKKKSGKLLSKIRKEVETLAKLKAKKRDNYICQRCQKKVEGSNAHASHIIPVSHGNVLRFNPRNMICLCYHCHINWWHKNPMESAEWFKLVFPEVWEYLKKEKEKIVKFKLEDYQKMKDALSK